MRLSVNNKKRSIVLCAFFVFACSDPKQTQQTSVNHSRDSYFEHVAPKPTALLTLDELLEASDVKSGLALAAANKDQQALREWQGILIKAANEVQLSEKELDLISGDIGLTYLEFEGMKTNYQAAFEDAFFNFEDVDRVYARYPAFKNLHAQSKAIVEQRDALVESVAKELEEQGLEPDTALVEARRQWQNFLKTQENEQ